MASLPAFPGSLSLLFPSSHFGSSADSAIWFGALSLAQQIHIVESGAQWVALLLQTSARMPTVEARKKRSRNLDVFPRCFNMAFFAGLLQGFGLVLLLTTKRACHELATSRLSSESSEFIYFIHTARDTK